jgi:hypothetical protein
MGEMINILRPITKAEWDKYDWFEVTSHADEHIVYIGSLRESPPPDDGFVYKDCTTIADTERKWRRIYTYGGEL